MPEAWRLTRAKYAATAFDGEGARMHGGRWNSRGVGVVYASAAISLAALEMLVHIDPMLPIRYVTIAVEFDDDMVEELPIGKLTPAWRGEPPGPATKSIGDAWARRARSAVLKLPSVIVPSEFNYLINPSHPDFARLRIGIPVAFAFDSRLLKTRP